MGGEDRLRARDWVMEWGRTFPLAGASSRCAGRWSGWSGGSGALAAAALQRRAQLLLFCCALRALRAAPSTFTMHQSPLSPAPLSPPLLALYCKESEKLTGHSWPPLAQWVKERADERMQKVQLENTAAKGGKGGCRQGGGHLIDAGRRHKTRGRGGTGCAGKVAMAVQTCNQAPGAGARRSAGEVGRIAQISKSGASPQRKPELPTRLLGRTTGGLSCEW